MEAIATLAGGIAHDFNNILAAIITNTEMALDDIEADTAVREHLEIVLQAGFRAKNVVRQIRTLSCQGEKEREPVQIELVAKECIKLLRASLPSTIDIPRKLVAGLGTVLIDPTQIHQIIMNLCTNAADAMREGGGTLSVSLARVEIGPDAEPSLPLLPSGHYLQLTVADNGHGMDNRTMERIFDPFFTTKGQGRGTGLGLSVVHAIVKNHHGAITVESVPGQGSVFRVFLPRVADPIARTEEIPAAAPLPRGKGESILLVDDEETFVFAVQKMLEHLGYRVVAGTDSREALEVFRAQSDLFDLIITDQTMPNLTGDRLAREMLKIRPDIPVILCSGSDPGTGSLSLREANSIGISELVTKPMDRRELAGVVRRVLDSR
jgi:CheY-like chemotaxis protein